MDARRRQLLRASLALATSGGLLASSVSFAAGGTGQRFIFVLLRGALDGLAAVPAIGDPDYARLRGELDITGAKLHRLDGQFALHPSLEFMAQQWNERQLAIVHAVATPYRDRSHFDAQDVLESGFARPHAAQSGWLNRALSGLPAHPGRSAGVALGANVPLVMRGPTEVASWSPGRLPDLDADTLQRIAQMYGEDALLSQRLSEALAADEVAATQSMGGRGPGAQMEQAARAAAGFLVQPDGPRVAVLETTGWDTHANQGSDTGLLALRLRALDGGLRVLRDALGSQWSNTVVLVATEFGRTVAVNGTRGTDHGTGAAAFLLGGAVRGGRVLGQWPGLKPTQLYQGRDLQPTNDLRAVIKTVLRDHLQVPQRRLESEVFPDSGATGYLQGLV